jgi:retron-type reverse transcriptase
VGNLLLAWQEFEKGKKNKKDVQEFSLCLMDNIFLLHNDLKNQTYKHGGYHAFNIADPKPRNIHKASVRDRLVHHAIYRILYPFFDKTFIADSYSCRLGKGTHKALERFAYFSGKVGRNKTATVWVLKCDIRKFFANIDHDILREILKWYIPDVKILALLNEVIGSFCSTMLGKGLPLGNLTSQLLVNIYMNEFDQFAKHQIKAEFYVRYADDFILLSDDREWLKRQTPSIRDFLRERLKLELHPKKLFLETLVSGIDFLGWVHFANHRVLRTVTKKKMFRKIKNAKSKEKTTDSYLGFLSHGNAKRLQTRISRELNF